MGVLESATERAAEPGEGDAADPRLAGGFGDGVLVAIAVAVTLPILWMGYGTDIDAAAVVDAADSIRSGGYEPSRPPGLPVFEVITAVLQPVGGHLLVNLATAGVAAATVVGLARLVRAWGHANGDLLALAFLAAPITLIASTSLVDFVWAFGFFVGGALAHLRERSLVAAILFALAVGCRLSTVFLIAAFLVADGWDAAHRRRCLRTVIGAAPLSVALYVPAWLAYDRSLDMFEPAEGFRGVANHLGRLIYKNYGTAGALFVVVLVVALPALVTALRRWRDDPMLRFAVLGFAVTEALYFQLPWKPGHLLPALACLLLWLGSSPRNQRPFLWIALGALAVNGLVAFRPLAPDEPGEARQARWKPSLVAGLLVNDIDCRIDLMDEPLNPRHSTEAWRCTIKPVSGPGASD